MEVGMPWNAVCARSLLPSLEAVVLRVPGRLRALLLPCPPLPESGLVPESEQLPTFLLDETHEASSCG